MTTRRSPEHVSDDQLLDLCAGLLSWAEVRDLVAHAHECGECEDRMRSALASHETARARLEGWLGRVPRAVRARPAVPGAGSLRRWGTWAAAAALVLVSVLWILPRNEPRDGTPGPRAELLPGIASVERTRARSQAPGGSDEWLGLAAYERREFSIAVEQLSAAVSDPGLHRMRRVYLASALLEIKAPARALVALQEVPATQLPEPWRSESDWMRFVAWTRTGARARADSILRQLCVGEGPVQGRARDWRDRSGRRP